MKAFRDTWRDGIHSYLSYLRDRLEIARDLLADSGSVFVQIGDENVHRVRAVMDEVFGELNFISLISFRKTSIGLGSQHLDNTTNYVVWYCKKSVPKDEIPTIVSHSRTMEGRCDQIPTHPGKRWAWAIRRISVESEPPRSRNCRAQHRYLTARETLQRSGIYVPDSLQDYPIRRYVP